MRKTTAYFVQQAKKVHGGKYNYSKANYSQMRDLVTIICSKHGPFLQSPGSHLSGYGCNKCGDEYHNKICTRNISSFIKEARKKHGDKYDYSKTKYATAKKKLTIICKKHGEFEQVANSHLIGCGCAKCSFEQESKDRRMSTRVFIRMARKIHKDRYNYSKVDYTNHKIKIIVICPIHGEFKIRPHDHIHNRGGCQKCRSSKGEFKIREFLKDRNISYMEEYVFTSGKSMNKIRRKKGRLRFDFYLPKHKLCVEYNGAQHYKPTERFGGLTTFKAIQNRDRRKKEWCKENKIRLLCIPYTKFDSVEQILEKEIFGKKNCPN
jgi:hypothetical protein